MNKKVLGVIGLALALLLMGFGTYYYFAREDKATSFTKMEREWIQNNKLKLIDLNIQNDIPVFNYVGEGLIFDFFKDFEQATELEFNRVAYNADSEAHYGFKMVSTVNANQFEIYKDNYLLLTTENLNFASIGEVKNLKIGVLKSDLASSKSILASSNQLTGYDNLNLLTTALGLDNYASEVEAVLVPKLLGLKLALNEKTYLALLVNEMNTSYVLELGDDTKLNTIIKKYYQKWAESNFEVKFNTYLTKFYFEFRGIDQSSMASFKGKRYTYGYTENAPYDLTISHDLYGTNKAILDNFATLADVEIVYKKYDNFEALIHAFESNNIDLFFNSTSKTGYDLDAFITSPVYDNYLVVISKNGALANISSINDLNGMQIAALKASNAASIIKEAKAKVLEYQTILDLVESKKDLIVLDLNNYDYYKKTNLANYKIEKIIDVPNYSFNLLSVANNKIFSEYLDFYLKTMSQKEFIGSGMNKINSKLNFKSFLKNAGFVLGLLAIYVLTFFLAMKKSKKQRPSISFKKSEKIRYMDMLTSLKNRNYLNDNIDKWESSKVYPQAIVIVDLNNIAYINDNYGHAAGDDEIKEAANVLIKNQVINSDIMRTNGNEFLIYLVGYKEKQIIVYIKKLEKELKELKHGFGAAIGYSMIIDDIKTIDDAINEATIEMRRIKEENNGEKTDNQN